MKNIYVENPGKRKALTTACKLFCIMSVAFILSFKSGFGQSTQTYTGSGTFVVPAGVTSIKAEAWGAGGGGGGALGGRGAGGGGGAFNVNNSLGVLANQSYTITVGAAGSAGSALGGGGGNGGQSIVTGTGGSVTANGGGGGAGGAFATGSPGGSGGIGGTQTGGNGSAATSSNSGAGGGGAGSTGSGTAAVGTTHGNGGTGNGGNGGDGLTANGGGNGGSIYGGGGGGGRGTNAGGAGAQGRVVITYTCPTYSLTSVGVSSPVCKGSISTVTLNSSAVGLPTGNYVVSYSFSGANTSTTTVAMTVSSAGTGTFNTIALALSGATTITINSLTSGTATGTGSTSPLCTSAIGANNTAVITANAPTATASSNTPFCIGGNLNLTGGAGGLSSYLWAGPSAYSSTSQSPTRSSATAGMAGTYTITVTDAVGCTASATTIVAASPAINPTIGSNTPFCNGGTLSLTSSGTGATGYLWSGPNGFSNTNQNPTISGAGVNEVGTYTVTVTNGNGCTASATTAVALATSPTVTTSTNPATTVCVGVSVTLQSSPTGGKTPYTYLWSTGATTQNPVITSSTTQTYTVTVTDNCGAVTASSVTLNVFPATVLTVTPTPASSLICGSGSVSINVSGANTYAWTPSTNLSATTGANVTASPTANVTYIVTGTAANGCTGTASNLVKYGIIPTATASASPSNICFGANSNLSSTAATTANYTMTTTTFALQSTAGFTNGPTGDDVISGAIALPWTFSFFGVNYSNIFINTNGQVGFDYTSSTASQQRTAQTLPSATLPNATISLCWRDLNASAAGMIKYGTIGSTPNRIFVIDFSAVPFLSGGGTVTGQIQLFEIDGKVQIHVSSVTTNTGVKTLGIENAAGTIGYAGTGRNNVNWLVSTPEAWNFQPSGGTFTFTWSPPDFLTSTTISNPVATAVTATTGYTVTATETSGCTATATTQINSSVALIATASATLTTICAGSSTNLSANVLSGSPNFAFEWTPATGLSSTSVSNPVASPTSGTIYTVSVTDACGGPATTATVEIFVNPTPPVTLSAVPANGVICGGGTVTLNASGATTYSWLPNTDLNTTVGATVVSSAVTTTTYTVTGSAGGCTASASQTVAVTPKTAVSATASPSLVCFNGSTTLSSFPVNTTNYVVSSIASNIISPVSPTNVVLADNSMSGAIPLPFMFNYFGRNNSQIFIGSNGFIQFQVNSGSTGVLGQTEPTATAPNNIIAGVWSDLNPAGGGTVRYFTSGASPNRVFVVDYSAVQMVGFLLGNGTCSFQIQLFENDNHVEVHIASVAAPAITLAGATTLGLKDNTGAIFIGPTGYFNNGNWSQGTAIGFKFSLSGTVSPAPTYSWTPATFLNSTTVQNPVASSVITGTTYTVTITTNTGCTATGTVAYTVTSALGLTCATSPSSPVCSASSITLQSFPTGGRTPYTYLWSTGATVQNPVITSTTTQTYTVTVTDNCGTSISCQALLTVNPRPTAVVTPASSGTVCGGSLTLTASTNAVTPSYQWMLNGVVIPSANSVTYNPLINGSYSVVITDISQPTLCAQTSNVVPLTFNVRPQLALTPNGTSSVCNGSTRTLSATSTPVQTFNGGAITIPGTLLAAANATPYPSSIAVSNLSSGSTVASVTINNFVMPVLNNVDMVLVSPTGVAVVLISDVGNSDPGGATYIFQDGAPSMGATAATSPVSGTYSCTNRTTGDNWPAPGPGTPSGQVVNPLLSSFTGNPNGQWNLFIVNDNAILSAAGSIGSWSITFNPPPITYAWTKSPLTSISTISPTNTASTTATINDSVTFIVTATDQSSGCTTSDSVRYNGIAIPTPRIVEGDSSVCSNVIEFYIHAKDIGAYSGGYPSQSEFYWVNYTLPTVGLDSLAINQPDVYTVEVTVPGGCTGTSNTINIDFNTQAPLPQLFQDSVDCFGESNGIAFTNLVIPGIPPYNYEWFNSSFQSVRNVTTNLTSDSLKNVPAGWYYLHARNNFGNNNGLPACDQFDSIRVLQPALLTVSESGHTNVLCFGSATGVIQIAPVGGTTQYHYLWSNGTTSQNATGLVAGTYTVLISDYHGCSTSLSSTITQPTQISISGSTLPTNCFAGTDGQVNISATGGTGAYTYLWSNSKTTQNLSSVAAGTYTVTVKDANLCTRTASFIVAQPTQIVSILDSSDSINCNGNSNGGLHITPSGGFGPYSFLWSNGATTEDITGITAGSYTVAITDQHGCTVFNTHVQNQPTAVAIVPTVITVSCNGNNDGSISVLGSGGTPGYTYLWNNGTTNTIISSLSPGNYTVTVQDANLCTKTTSYAITEPAVLTTSCSGADALCYNGASGTIGTNTNGGTTPYHYLWSNGQTSATATGLLTGSYTVTITDARGCVTSCSSSIGQPTTIVTSGITTNVACKGNSTGSIDYTVSGGSPGYTYLWSNLNTNQDISGLATGTYFVTVTDAHGCTKTNAFTITEPTNGIAISVSKTNVRCFNGNNGAATAIPTGGTAPYGYLWNNGTTASSISNLVAGNYTVTVSDATGCTKSLSFSITQNPSIVIIIAPVNPITALASVSGGVAPYTYYWNTVPAQTNATATSLVPGNTYTVKVTDSKGCSKLASIFMPTPKLDGNNLADLSSVKVYPNPNSGLFTINFGSNISDVNYQLTVMDLNGKVIKINTGDLQLNNQEKTFDFSELSKGIYLLKIAVSGNSVIKRLIIQ